MKDLFLPETLSQKFKSQVLRWMKLTFIIKTMEAIGEAGRSYDCPSTSTFSPFRSVLPGLAFSRPDKQILPFFKLVSFQIFEILLISWPFLKVYRSLYSRVQNFSFLKTELGIFQLQAPGNPGSGTGLMLKLDGCRYPVSPHVYENFASLSWALAVFFYFFNNKK